MCLPERCTCSRARPLVTDASLTAFRTTPLRRWVLALTVAITFSVALQRPLLLLAFLAEDVFAGVLHALALVGLRRPEIADLGGDLADLLLVRAGDGDLGRLRRHDRDAFRNRIDYVVAVAELKLKVLALDRGTIADAGDLK